jgi:hypothetical protein
MFYWVVILNGSQGVDFGSIQRIADAIVKGPFVEYLVFIDNPDKFINKFSHVVVGCHPATHLLLRCKNGKAA